MNNPSNRTVDASRTRVAFLGCGNIAGEYAKAMVSHTELELIGAFDLDAAKRAEFAGAHGCQDFSSLDDLCAAEPDIVVNLTTAPYHYATTLDLIERGRTVFSEKPLALHSHEARELVERAAKAEVRLACAPSVWLGRAQQEFAAAIADRALGSVRLITAEVNQGRIETWHPVPFSFYQVGPVVDAGIYPIAYLTALFGPITTVTAVSASLLPDRRTLGGQDFSPQADDAWIVLALFAGGPLLRLTCNFYVSSDTVPRTIDVHGDAGTLRLADWIMPGSEIGRARYGEPVAVSAEADDTQQIDWAVGLADLAAAIAQDRPHRTGAEHAAHVVDVLEAIARSAQSGTRVDIDSTFPAP